MDQKDRQEQQNNSDNQQDRSSFMRWVPNMRIVLLILSAILLWNIFFGMSSSTYTLNMPYSSFLTQVQEGNVENIEIVGQRISGELKEAIVAPEGAEINGGLPFADVPEQVADFQTTLPIVGDDRLLPLLEDQGVVVNASVEQRSILFDLLYLFLPLAVFVAVIYFFTRSQMRGQQGIFNFGRSRAKQYSIDHPTVKFSDVAGADEAKRELVEVVDFLKNPDRYKQLGAKIPRGVLLVGSPGTGKTLLARSVAGEAGVPFYSTSASEFVEMFVGVGASRVRDLFDQARRNAPAIIFVDEVDAIGRQRGTGIGGGHDEREQTLNQILVEMDGFESSTNVIIIAATNRPDVLDQALLRPGRFDRQITVGLPDVRGREAVLNIHLQGKPVAADIDVATVARQTPGFAGADLANLVNEAALHAARAQVKQIGMHHFAEALDKIVLGTERPLLMTDHDRRVVAYHEAGHALVARLLPETDPVNKITIIPRGRALGVTEYLPEGDRVNYSRQYLLSQLAALLGGRAAEQVAIGEITTGAESDLQRATQMARRMLGRWGMSEELGMIFVDGDEDSPFMGRQMGGSRNHSEATAAMLDQSVRELLDERLGTAVRLLSENRAALDRMAQGLLQYETLDRAAVEAAIRGDEIPGSISAEAEQADTPASEQADEQPAPRPVPGILPA